MRETIIAIIAGLYALGCLVDSHNLRVKPLDSEIPLFKVELDGSYFGIWDDIKETFID